MNFISIALSIALSPAGEVACTPMLAPRSAAVAYVEGALAPVTAWAPLLAGADQHNAALEAVLTVAMKVG